jgi:hypothetical protein
MSVRFLLTPHCYFCHIVSIVPLNNVRKTHHAEIKRYRMLFFIVHYYRL